MREPRIWGDLRPADCHPAVPIAGLYEGSMSSRLTRDIDSSSYGVLVLLTFKDGCETGVQILRRVSSEGIVQHSRGTILHASGAQVPSMCGLS